MKLNKIFFITLFFVGCNAALSPNEPVSSLNKQLIAALSEIPDLKNIQALINQGADVNVRDTEQKTPLHLAITNLALEFTESFPQHLKENLEIVKFLIKKGANVNAQDKDRFTPLHLLFTSGSLVYYHDTILHTPEFIDVLKILIENGADLTIKATVNPGLKQTPLELIDTMFPSYHSTIREDHIKLVREAIQEAQQVAEQKKQKLAEVFAAVEASDNDAIKKLAKEISFNYVVDKNGNNPLHKAVLKSDKDTIALIYSIQPKLAQQKNNDGETPIDLTVHRRDILALFVQLGYKK